MTLPTGFRHETLLYGSDQELLATAVPFIEGGLEDDDPVLVVASAANLDLLADALGADAARVDFADSASYGRRPARRIANFHRYWQQRARDIPPGHRMRVLAEPAWAGQPTVDTLALRRIEAGLNVIFEAADLHMICPYDVRVAGAELAAESRRTHPSEALAADSRPSAEFVDPAGYAAACDESAPLPEPPATAVTMTWDGDLFRLRSFVAGQAAEHGVARDQIDLWVLAVNEVGTYLGEQGVGTAAVRMWRVAEDSVCDLATATPLQSDPYLGFYPPGTRRGAGGEGLWLARQICESVEIRSRVDGWQARLRMPGAGVVEPTDSDLP